MQLQPGVTVTVTVNRPITNRAAARTLARIFLKDPEVSRRRRHRPKQVETHMRGGRLWRHRKPGSVAVTPRVGDHCRLVCTVDVIRDLASVERFIEVQPAQSG